MQSASRKDRRREVGDQVVKLAIRLPTNRPVYRLRSPTREPCATPLRD